MPSMPEYEEFTFNAEGYNKSVFTKGSGPGILLMHELPGMVEQCVRLGDYIASRSYTVFLPLLFGEANVSYSKVRTALYAIQICIRREILAFAAAEDSPITNWLRARPRYPSEMSGWPWGWRDRHVPHGRFCNQFDA